MPYRHDDELKTRWNQSSTADVIDALLRGRPASPYGKVNGRIDLRGLDIEQPARTPVNENLSRIAKTFQFDGKKVIDVDFSGANLPEWRIFQSAFVNCVFDKARLSSLRTFSAQFVRCSFSAADLKGASLGAASKERKPGGRYEHCDFRGANLQEVKVDPGYFVDCDFQWTRWKRTQTLSTVFERCDFRDATVESVNFDGRYLHGRGRPDRLGDNKLKDCDFSTAVLKNVAFIAIDFRNCVPPMSGDVVLIADYPARCRSALAALAEMSGEDARAAEAILRIEADDAHLLADDAIGVLSLSSYPGGRRDAVTAAFDLAQV